MDTRQITDRELTQISLKVTARVVAKFGLERATEFLDDRPVAHEFIAATFFHVRELLHRQAMQ